MRFEDVLRQAGLYPRDVVADGRIHRCPTEDKPKKRNGWYWLSLDGRRGAWGDNARAPREALGRWADDSGAKHHPPDPAQVARMRRMAEQRRAERRAAVAGARKLWAASTRLVAPHPYLERKGLGMRGCGGLRVHRDMLVVPVQSMDGRLQSVQTINSAGAKRYWPGAPIDAGSHLISGASPGGVTVLVEGLATGLAVYQCMRHARVLVCFDTGNLVKVARQLPGGSSIVIAADNDVGTQARLGRNPGLDAARAAAEAIGCGVAYPRDIEGTDWADAYAQWGPESARRIERLILAEARYVLRRTA